MSILKIVGTETELRFDLGAGRSEETDLSQMHDYASLILTEKGGRLQMARQDYNYLSYFLDRFISLDRSSEVEKIIDEHLDKYKKDNLGKTDPVIVSRSEEMLKRLGFGGGYTLSGHRVYVDGDHPEICTPECSNPMDLVKWEKAGEELAKLGCELFKERFGMEAVVYKNVSDGHGSSWGAHENYLVEAKLFEQLTHYRFQWLANYTISALPRVIGSWATFLISRYIYAGAGKIGPEKSIFGSKRFMISQRAEFMEKMIHDNTTATRPFVNTRDIPYVGNEFGRRLHVICGDANRCEWPIYLKVGMAMIILMMMEDEENDFESWPVLDDPFYTLHSTIDRGDINKKTRVRIGNSSSEMTLIEIQEYLVEMANKWFQDRCANIHPKEKVEWMPILLNDISGVLLKLRTDPRSLFGVLDWVNKLTLLERVAGQEWPGLGERQTVSRETIFQLDAMDMLYHRISDKSVYDKLAKAGRIKTLIDREQIKDAADNPPQDTRAYDRTLLMSRLGGSVRFVNWQYIEPKAGEVFNLPSPWRISK